MSNHAAGVQAFLGRPTVICSPPMQRLMQTVVRVAQSSASVLILGETGSGKEHIARAIHHHSRRCAKPWVDLNCSTLPEHLIESELFGYEKGAFSGATATKSGLLELADGGTIFLDEIGELDPRMQVKLLRVLDGMPYYRLGGVRKIAVDVRVVAATNQNLVEFIKTGKFRSDLYHRLSQVSLEVQPLRSRREDILPLAEFFLSECNQEARFTESSKQALLNWNWPGNVRELRNTVLRSAILAESNVVDVQLSPGEAPRASGAERPLHLESLERQAILDALAQTGNHHQQAADLLGISTRTLARKLKLYKCEADHVSLAG